MTDWKQKVAAFKEQERIVEEQRKALELAERSATLKIAEENAQKERAAQVKLLGEMFVCHVCKKPAIKPKATISTVYHGAHDNTSSEDIHGEDWTVPGDLFKCKECEEWTCSDCLADGICKNDWAKKLGQIL